MRFKKNYFCGKFTIYLKASIYFPTHRRKSLDRS